MKTNVEIINNNMMNKDGIVFPINVLIEHLSNQYLSGSPSHISHDVTRPYAWGVPFGIYFQPKHSCVLAKFSISENQSEKDSLLEHSQNFWRKHTKKNAEHYTDDVKAILSKKDIDFNSDNLIYLSGACYKDSQIVFKLFPEIQKLFDKDELIAVKDLIDLGFQYLGQGVFGHNDSGAFIYAHQYFRTTLSLNNNLNYHFLDKLLSLMDIDEIKIKISIDKNIIGFIESNKTCFEFEYWRGPTFNDNISSIKTGVCVHNNTDIEKFYYGINKTEFWWKLDKEGHNVLEIEEITDIPSDDKNKDSFGCRYIHSIFDDNKDSFKHFDGAIRLYDGDSMLDRLEVNDISYAGKYADYTKLFRIDGALKLDLWKSLIQDFFRFNSSIEDYFNIENSRITSDSLENDSYNSEEKNPYDICNDDGIQIFLSKELSKDSNNNYPSTEERFILNDYNNLYHDKNAVEDIIIEIKKSLNANGVNIFIPNYINMLCVEDFNWNIPTISHHGHGSDLESSISQTIRAIKSVYQVATNDNLSSFAISWMSDSVIYTLSIFGSLENINKWLENTSNIPVNDEKIFNEWLTEQYNWLKINFPKSGYIDIRKLLHCNRLFLIRPLLPENINATLQLESNNLICKIECSNGDELLVTKLQNQELFCLPLQLIEQNCSICNDSYLNCQHSVYHDDMEIIVNKVELLEFVISNNSAW